MEPAILELLRCPIDPQRQAPLVRKEQVLVCQGCSVQFPIKQGIPILIVREADLPPGCKELSQLPCQRRANRQSRD